MDTTSATAEISARLFKDKKIVFDARYNVITNLVKELQNFTFQIIWRFHNL